MPPDPSAKTVPENRCRVVLADDHELICEGIAAVIAREPEFTICGRAVDEEGVLTLVERHRPDVLLIDFSICRRDALTFLRHLTSKFPATRVLALAAFAEERYAERVLLSGARGYFLKSMSGAELLRALRTVAASQIYTSPRLGSLAKSFSDASTDATSARPQH